MRLTGVMCFLLAFGSCIAIPASAEPCEGNWLPGEGFPGINGTVYATTMWDPDGPGPLGEQLVAAGEFAVAGSEEASNIAAWDGVAWRPLASGIAGGNPTTRVYSLAKMSDGSLIAGGRFATAGGVAASGIARWDGFQWTSFGSGFAHSSSVPVVRALCVGPTGNLFAGGSFTSVDGTPALNIASWNGSNWSGLASGTNGTVRAVSCLSTGELIVGGEFTLVPGISGTISIAKWDGATWSRLGSSGSTAVSSIAILPTNEVLVAMGTQVRKWSGSAWASLGSSFSASVNVIAATSSGQPVAGGSFTSASGSAANRIAIWNGAAWAAIGEGLSEGFTSPAVHAISSLSSGELVVAGYFNEAGNKSAVSIASWDGSSWKSFGAGFDSDINSLCLLPSGDLVAGGGFQHAGSIDANGLCNWNGLEWSGLGSGVGGTAFATVLAVGRMPNNDLVAGGRFLTINGISANNVARFDGYQWASIGTGMDSLVYCFAVLPDGDLVAGGGFANAGGSPASNIARWNGSQWLPMGAGLNGAVYGLTVHGGKLVAGGIFTKSGATTINRIAQWTGTEWEALGEGFANGNVNALVEDSNNDLIAAGSFTLAGVASVKRIARWDGQTWNPIGDGFDQTVLSVCALPNGGLVAGGAFAVAGNTPANRIAQWTGVEWLPLTSGVSGMSGVTFVSTVVRAVAVLPSGEIAVGGSFVNAGGRVASFFARWSPEMKVSVALQPTPGSVQVNETIELSAAPANGFEGVSYRWQRNGVDVQDGLHGASIGGGNVTGASGVCGSPTAMSTVVLSISGVQVSDAGEYAAVFTNSCGQSESHAAAVAVFAACPGDFNSDFVVDDNDFSLFVVAYNLLLCDDPAMPANCPADLNGDLFVDDSDFTVFVVAYNELLCP